MSKISSAIAAEIVGVTPKIIWQDVKEGRLVAELINRRGVIRINIDDLRRYAQENRRRFDEEKVKKYLPN